MPTPAPRAPPTTEEEEFEARLRALKTAKGETPIGEGKKKQAKEQVAAPKAEVSWDGEEVFFEGGPATGDLVLNIALSWTVLWLPITLASIGRSAWLKYRITDKRVSVISTSPFENGQSDIAYAEMKDVVAAGRFVGAWGDVVITLRNGDKLEILRVPNFMETRDFIRKRIEEAQGKGSGSSGGKGGDDAKGFA